MNHLEQTLQFRKSAGLPVADTQTIPSIADRKLNLALLLEEASELAEAYGLEGSFRHMMHERIMSGKPRQPDFFFEDDTEEYNAVEVLDALCDITVINDGAVCTSGFQGVMADAMSEVFKSNMSKVGLTENEAIKEGIRYGNKGDHYAVATPVPNHHCAYCIRRSTDGELLKPSTFIAPSLSVFIQPQ